MIASRIILGLALPIAILSGGCKREETIHTYSAPKDAITPALVADASADMPGESPHHAPTLGSLGFPADLRWTLPAGWKQVAVPPNPVFMPVAAIEVSADQPAVVLTISQMPDSPGARSVMANVTRWCRQLKIDPPAEADLGKYVANMPIGGVAADVVALEGPAGSSTKLLGAMLSHGADTWVFKLSGPASVVDSQNGAFADFLHSVHFDNAPATPTAAPSAGPNPVGPTVTGPPLIGPPAPGQSPAAAEAGATGLGGAQWVLPAGWTAQPGDGLRLATIRPGNTPAEIKVSKLGIIAGGAGMNVSRWHGEVGLPPVDDEHADAGTPMKIADQAWTIHDYTGPANGGTREIIAMAQTSQNTWYFKLVGPTDVIGKLQADFDQFVKSIRLP